MWILMAILCTLVTARKDLFHQDGVFVQRMDEVRRVAAVWQLIIVAAPPVRPPIEEWVGQIRAAIHSRKGIKWWKELSVEHWEHRMHNLLQRVQKEEMTVQYPTRIKRSPFDFVGAGASWLFGLATNDQLVMVQRAVRHGEMRTNAIAHNQKLMLTMLNHTRDIQIHIGENLKKIKIFIERTRILARQADYQRETLQRAIQIGVAVDEITSAVIAYERQKDNMNSLRAQISAGVVTRQLLNTLHLQGAMGAAKREGFTTLPMKWYYANAVVNHIREDHGALVYAVALPMIADDRYILYGLSYLPMRLGEKHIRYVNGAARVAVNTGRRSSFLPDDCIGTKPVLCRPRAESTVTTCEIALITGGNPSACEITIKRQTGDSATVLPPAEGKEITAIAPHIKTLKVAVLCPGKETKQLIITEPVLVKLPSDCRLETDGWMLNSVIIKEVTIKLERVKPELSLPPLNISWPQVLHPEWDNQMKMIPELKVPLLDIKGIVEVPHGYVSATGYRALWLTVAVSAAVCCIIIVAVCILRSRIKCSRKKKNSAHWLAQYKKDSKNAINTKTKKKEEKVLRFGDTGERETVKGGASTLWLTTPEVL